MDVPQPGKLPDSINDVGSALTIIEATPSRPIRLSEIDDHF
jgi:hypothetical protein